MPERDASRHRRAPSYQGTNWRTAESLLVNVRVAFITIVLLACSVKEEAPNIGSSSSASVDARRLAAIPEPKFDSAGLAGLTCSTLTDSVFLVPRPTRALLLQAYGVPDSVSASTEPNRHVAGVIDSLLRVHYPGLTASFRKPGEGSDLVTDVVVTDNRFLRFPSLGIGARGSRLIQVLGDPWTLADDRIEYNCVVDADQPVTFWLVGGQVRRVSKYYYVD